MTDLVLWRRLTKTDFNSMHGEASPRGRGGGAMHVALGVDTKSFLIKTFLKTRREKVTITTEAWPGRHPAATLTFSGNPTRRRGEWRIADQYSHRHPAWKPAAGFPTAYDSKNPPHILVFKANDKYHVRFASERELIALGTDAPSRRQSERKGISPANFGLLAHFHVPTSTLLDAFEEQAKSAPAATFDPRGIEDGRRRVFAEILVRQGQATFRNALLSVYANRCAITGSRSLWVLEAAHITPYRGTRTNTLANGLLLRADVHTLFDLGLISVDPDTLQIKVSSQLNKSEYSKLHGKKLSQPKNANYRPSKPALQEHYRYFRG
jgi:hypothetical protein